MCLCANVCVNNLHAEGKLSHYASPQPRPPLPQTTTTTVSFVCAFHLTACARAFSPQGVRARTCARLHALTARGRRADEAARSAAQKVMAPLASRPDQSARTCWHHSPTHTASAWRYLTEAASSSWSAAEANLHFPPLP